MKLPIQLSLRHFGHRNEELKVLASVHVKLLSRVWHVNKRLCLNVLLTASMHVGKILPWESVTLRVFFSWLHPLHVWRWWYLSMKRTDLHLLYFFHVF